MKRASISEIRKLTKQISNKRKTAKYRKIPTMSTDEFLKLAFSSPHWRKIGNTRGKYNFCRRDHSLGYTPQNTFIGKASKNIKDAAQRRAKTKFLSRKQRAARLRAQWRRSGKRKREKIRARRCSDPSKALHDDAHCSNQKTKLRAPGAKHEQALTRTHTPQRQHSPKETA